MSFLVLLVLFLFFFVVVPRLSRKGAVSGDARTRLLTTGLEARGLILSAASTGSQTTVNGQRFQVRSVVLDVEVPGRPPYELSLSPMFPRLCEPFPGSALDLRVDPQDPKTLVVVGPAGSSAWMGATAGLFPWAPATTPVSRSGCGTVVIVLVSLVLALGAVLSFVSGSSPREAPEAPAVTPHVTPAPHASAPAANGEPAVSVHPTCEAAMRCCKTLGHPRCAAYATMSESACKAVLHQESLAAAKVHKTCE